MTHNNYYWRVVEKDGDEEVILDFDIINAPMFDAGDAFVTTARGTNAVINVRVGDRRDIIDKQYAVIKRSLAGLWTLTVNSYFPIA